MHIGLNGLQHSGSFTANTQVPFLESLLLQHVVLIGFDWTLLLIHVNDACFEDSTLWHGSPTWSIDGANCAVHLQNGFLWSIFPALFTVLVPFLGLSHFQVHKEWPLFLLSHLYLNVGTAFVQVGRVSQRGSYWSSLLTCESLQA